MGLGGIGSLLRVQSASTFPNAETSAASVHGSDSDCIIPYSFAMASSD